MMSSRCLASLLLLSGAAAAAAGQTARFEYPFQDPDRPPRSASAISSRA